MAVETHPFKTGPAPAPQRKARRSWRRPSTNGKITVGDGPMAEYSATSGLTLATTAAESVASAPAPRGPQPLGDSWVIFAGALVAAVLIKEAMRGLAEGAVMAQAKTLSRTDGVAAVFLGSAALYRVGSWAVGTQGDRN